MVDQHNLQWDGADHIRAARAWLEAHPGNREAEGELAAWLADRAATEAVAPYSDALTWAQLPDPAPQPWVVQWWLPLGHVTLLSGTGGFGKSRLGLQLGVAAASGGGAGAKWLDGPSRAEGLPLLGESVASTGVPVLYASWEDRHRTFSLRLLQITDSYHNDWVTRERVGDRLRVLDMSHRGPLWGPSTGRHVSTAATLLEAGHRIRATAEEMQAVVVVVDPLAAAFASNENDRALVRGFVADFDAWASAQSLAVFIIGHPSMAGAEKGYAGSTDWHNSVRARWSLSKEKVGKAPPRNALDRRPERWRLHLAKSNLGPWPVPDWDLEWHHSLPDECHDHERLFWSIRGRWDEAEEAGGDAAHSASGKGRGYGEYDD